MFGILRVNPQPASDIANDSKLVASVARGRRNIRHLSCEQCRARKIRCSGDRAGCERCGKLLVKCRYPSQDTRRRTRTTPEVEAKPQEPAADVKQDTRSEYTDDLNIDPSLAAYTEVDSLAEATKDPLYDPSLSPIHSDVLFSQTLQGQHCVPSNHKHAADQVVEPISTPDSIVVNTSRAANSYKITSKRPGGFARHDTREQSCSDDDIASSSAGHTDYMSWPTPLTGFLSETRSNKAGNAGLKFRETSMISSAWNNPSPTDNVPEPECWDSYTWDQHQYHASTNLNGLKNDNHHSRIFRTNSPQYPELSTPSMSNTGQEELPLTPDFAALFPSKPMEPCQCLSSTTLLLEQLAGLGATSKTGSMGTLLGVLRVALSRGEASLDCNHCTNRPEIHTILAVAFQYMGVTYEQIVQSYSKRIEQETKPRRRTRAQQLSAVFSSSSSSGAAWPPDRTAAEESKHAQWQADAAEDVLEYSKMAMESGVNINAHMQGFGIRFRGFQTASPGYGYEHGVGRRNWPLLRKWTREPNL